MARRSNALKANELISQLQKLVDEFGDMPVLTESGMRVPVTVWYRRDEEAPWWHGFVIDTRPTTTQDLWDNRHG